MTVMQMFREGREKYPIFWVLDGDWNEIPCESESDILLSGYADCVVKRFVGNTHGELLVTV